MSTDVDTASDVVAAVEKVDAAKQRKQELANLVTGFSGRFGSILPSHMHRDGNGGEMFSALALMALRKPEIAEAALNDPQKFLSALVQSARLGHQPGTEAFYLVPVAPKYGQPRVIEGWEGYRGIVERLYRAGVVTSVRAQVVRENDLYEYEEGMLHPRWAKPQKFASDAMRGERIGVFAYAKLLRGGVEVFSAPQELGADQVAMRKAMSKGSTGEHSPWVKWTDSMWMKCVARELEKWVPSSAEYQFHMMGSAVRVREISQAEGLPEPSEPMATVEGEIVEGDGWPEVAKAAEQ